MRNHQQRYYQRSTKQNTNQDTYKQSHLLDYSKKIDFRHAQKLKQIQTKQNNNIDHLNTKIINLINRLNIQQGEGNTDYFGVGEGKREKERLKTDYGWCGGEIQIIKGLDSEYMQLNKKKKDKMAESKIIQYGLCLPQRQNMAKKGVDIDKIRRKYKEDDGKMLKQDKSYLFLTTFNENSTLNNTSAVKSNRNDVLVNNTKSYKYNDAQKTVLTSQVKHLSELHSSQRMAKDRKALQDSTLNYQNSSHKSNTNCYDQSNRPSDYAYKSNIKSSQFKIKDKSQFEKKGRQERFSSVIYSSKMENQYESASLQDLVQGFKKKLQEASNIPLSSTQKNNHLPFSKANTQSRCGQSQSNESMMLRSFVNTISRTQLQDRSNYNDSISDSQEPLTADFRDNNQLQHFIANLKQQIKLDSIFRNCKKWFQRHTGPNKWKELLLESNAKALDLNETELKEIFTLRQEEENPFYHYKQSQYSIALLVDNFLKSQEHWYEYIIKRYNYASLCECGLNQSKLDRLQKGYIQISDLARFINLQSRQIYYNRDLILIFQRLRGQQLLIFDDLVQTICQ